jgi:hypothetical protein
MTGSIAAPVGTVNRRGVLDVLSELEDIATNLESNLQTLHDRVEPLLSPLEVPRVAQNASLGEGGCPLSFRLLELRERLLRNLTNIQELLNRINL